MKGMSGVTTQMLGNHIQVVDAHTKAFSTSICNHRIRNTPKHKIQYKKDKMIYLITIFLREHPKDDR